MTDTQTSPVANGRATPEAAARLAPSGGLNPPPPAWGTPDTPPPGTGTAPDEGPAAEAEARQDAEQSGQDTPPRADQPAPARPGPGEVIPSWARSREAFTGMAEEWTRRTAHAAAFHTTRSPLYWLRCLPPAVRTLGRMIRWLYRYSFDAEGKRIRRELSNVAGAGRSEAVTFHGVTQQHRGVVRERLLATGLLLGLLGMVGAAVVLLIPRPVLIGLSVVLVPFLAWFSRDPARPVTSAAGARYAGPPPFNDALLAAALEALGIAQLSRGLKAEGLKLAGPIHRDGPGWRADVDLPIGVTADAIAEKRAELAAGLRRPLGCVWPEGDPDSHEARLVLWVGDRAPNRAKPKPWALARTGKVDLFAPFPFGTNPQGRPVTVCLMFASMIIGAVPRMGKTFALRLLLLAAALDVLAEIHAYDLKGGADLRCMGPVCHRFRIGDEEDDIAYLAADAAELKTQMQRRYRVMRSLPEAICPEGKVTPELAKRKDLRLHPIVIGIDECQIAFGDEEHGKAIEADITDLVKRGPAVGIIVILATQRPDAKAIPPGISGNAVLRFCLRVMGHVANDLVLGTGAYKSGIRATMFARSDLGTGYLSGEADDPQIVRTGYVDGPMAKSIVARARAARESAGTVTGYAADLDLTPEPTETPTLLDDLGAVMAPTDNRVPGAELVIRLAAHRPGVYDGWSASTLGTAVGALGLRSVQCNGRDPQTGKAVNPRGLAREDVLRAITERDAGREAGGRP